MIWWMWASVLGVDDIVEPSGREKSPSGPSCSLVVSGDSIFSFLVELILPAISHLGRSRDIDAGIRSRQYARPVWGPCGPV